MPRTYDSEVPAVEGCERRDAAALRNSDDARIHQAESEVGVLLDQLDATRVIRYGQVNDLQRSARDEPKEPRLRGRPKSGLDEPGRLRDDGRGYEQLSAVLSKQVSARLVSRLIRIGGRQENACVEEQGHVSDVGGGRASRQVSTDLTDVNRVVVARGASREEGLKRVRGDLARETLGHKLCRDLLHPDATSSGCCGQGLAQLIGKVHGDGHVHRV